MQLTTVRKLIISTIWQRWAKISIAVSAALMLGTCTPLPSLIDQIKTLGELRVVTRNGPLAFYTGADGQPAGRSTNWRGASPTSSA